MSLITKLGTNLSKGIVEIAGTKPVKKTAVRTTAQTVGSTTKAVAGGRTVSATVAQATAKGAGTSGKILGKVIVPAGLATAGAGAIILGGASVYDYTANILSKTPEQRVAAEDLQLQNDAQEIAERRLDTLRNYYEIAGGTTGYGQPTSDALDILFNRASPEDATIAQAEADKSASFTALILGAGVIAGGLYIFSRKEKQSKKKKAGK